MSNQQDNPTSAAHATDEMATEANSSPQVASVASTSAIADHKVSDDTKAAASGARKKKPGEKKLHKNSNHRKPGQNQDGDPGEKNNLPPSLRERLLARFVPPSIPLAEDLLPEALLKALDGLGLGRADVFPLSAFATIAAIAAVAGPSVVFAENADPKLGSLLGTGSSLRVVVVGEHAAGPIVPGPIMASVYAVENDLLASHEQSVERVAALRRVTAERRRLHDHATRAAAILGNAQPPALSEQAPVVPARPRIVLVNGASSAILEAAAGGTGVIVVDRRWVKSLLAGDNRDVPTADLLNTIAMGHGVPVVDPRGRTEMRVLPACVIGALAPAECFSLHRVAYDQLAATVFVNAAATSASGDNTRLTALMRRIEAMTAEPTVLRFGTKARQMLSAAATGWSEIDAPAAPLSDYVAGLADLTRRLAGVFHIIECAGTGADLKAEISVNEVKRATSLVDGFVLPMARAILGPISCKEVERDARTMVNHLRQNTSPEVPVARRPWMRAYQNSMPLPRFEAALNLLLQEQLLTPTEGEDGGKWYAASAELHDAA